MKPTYIIWHCSASRFGCAATIRQWHLKRGWADVGYHLICLNGVLTPADAKHARRVPFLDGSLEVGRVWDGDGELTGAEVGAHAYGFNRDAFGLCLIGTKTFSRAQIDSALRATKALQLQYGVLTENVIGHYEIGRRRIEYATTKTCPNLDMSAIRYCLEAEAELDALCIA